jgi:trimethylamine---corrinoid protein Co-methyltransferase
LKLSFEVLSDSEVHQIHDASLRVLERTGMRFASRAALQRLAAAGAKVDLGARVARFPRRLVEESISSNQKALKAGRRLHLLNGVTSELSDLDSVHAKVGGGCEKYLDWERQSVQEADAEHLLRFVRLGESIPEVGFVGNPIVMRYDTGGRKIEERMRRIRTAALVAKNTRKLGSMEVWSAREIDYLVEIGCIARGGRDEYLRAPCLVTAKETISPLFVDQNAMDILVALAERGLPCTIIPMPLTGMSAPVTKLGNAIIANAEILAVLTAVKAFHPDALVGGGSISGLLDMKTGAVSFSAPEAILQDIAVAEVHQRLYGFDYLVGSGYTDAKYPNAQLLAEKLAKYLLTYLSGRATYPVGLINSGSVFSDVQCLVDIELCRYIHGHFGRFDDFGSLDELVSLIQKVGIQGSYVAEEHTLQHFRESWLPQILDRTSFSSIPDSKAKDIYAAANDSVSKISAERDAWQIDSSRAKAIDEVVEKAEREL